MPDSKPSFRPRSGSPRLGAGGLPTPSTTESSGRSGDSDEPLIEVQTARYRAAWPKLRRTPLELSADAKLPLFIQPFVQQIKQQARSILESHQVTDDEESDGWVDINLANVETVGDPQTRIPTLMVCASWTKENQASWVKAVHDIGVYLHKVSVAGNFDHGLIQIDIIAPNLTQTIYYGPVSDKRYNSWDTIKKLVCQRLESFEATKGHTTLIGLFHYGRSICIPDNPVTVYIAVDFESDETQWLGVIADIERNIHSRGWTGVQVHMEHNVGMNHSFPLLTPEGNKAAIRKDGVAMNKRIEGDYQQLVNLGADFGPAAYIKRTDNVDMNPGAATLGCYVELKTERNPDWTKYALTNYHAVRPAFAGYCRKPGVSGSELNEPRQNSDLRKVDQYGFSPISKVPSIALESPSRAKHNFIIWAIDENITRLTNDNVRLEAQRRAGNNDQLQSSIDENKRRIQEAKNEKQKKVEFFNNGKHMLGKVFAASGFFRRTPGNMRLDWALISVDVNRQGSNRLPARDVWDRKYLDDIPTPYGSLGSILKDQSTTIGPGNPEHVWKVGATTGPTTATYNNHTVECRLSDDSYLKNDIKNYLSTEYIFQSHDGVKFCAPGDSGSAVWDENGGIVGLFFRGHSINKSFDDGFGLVTPIELVFEDIKQFSKGTITEIRVAKS